ncbi:MAG: bacillithiol system redox-active protein YtxJ [Bacteroidia bacterium]|nr:bacillithiol system redox-active protein YtxJ [Bacteroidia bacterium]
MQWNELTDIQQLEGLISSSNEVPFIIFKHSTRCSISLMAKSRLERQTLDGLDLPFYYLDLLKFRPVSNAVSDILSIEHQSPQILLVSKEKCLYNASHGSIDLEELKLFLKNAQN